MTPTQSSSPPPAGAPAPRRSSTSIGQVFALVAAFLALAAIGAGIGWAVTDTSGGGTPQAQGTTPPATPTPSLTPSPSPASAPSVSGSVYQIPNFHTQGTSFIDARTQIMAKKIGVAVKFTPTPGGTDVVAYTKPAAGTLMHKGQSITLYVNEAPPLLAVPPVTGLECNAAGSQLAAVGFMPKYPSGRVGTVTLQSVPSTSATAHWNDPIAITCLVAPTASTSSPAVAPSNSGPASGPPSPP